MSVRRRSNNNSNSAENRREAAPGNIVPRSFLALLEEPRRRTSISTEEEGKAKPPRTELLAEVVAYKMINDILMIFNISRCSSFTKSAGQNNKLLYCIIRLVHPCLSACLSCRIEYLVMDTGLRAEQNRVQKTPSWGRNGKFLLTLKRNRT